MPPAYWPVVLDIAPHRKDAPYFALALKEGAAIWSDEAAFGPRKKPRILTTHELDTDF